MKKVVFLLLLIPVAVMAQELDNQQNVFEDAIQQLKPHISFDSKEFDFGYSPQGNAFLVHAFKVTNSGGATLEITNVRPTCGCTAAPLKKNSLEPGESTEITSIFRLSGYRHPTTKSIMVMSNDSLNPTVPLKFSANMDTTIWFDPSATYRIFSTPMVIDLGKGDSLRKEANVTLECVSDQKLKLTVIDYTRDFIREPKIKDNSLKGEESTEMKIQLNENLENQFEIKASITVAAMDQDENEVTRITIPITGFLNSEIKK